MGELVDQHEVLVGVQAGGDAQVPLPGVVVVGVDVATGALLGHQFETDDHRSLVRGDQLREAAPDRLGRAGCIGVAAGLGDRVAVDREDRRGLVAERIVVVIVIGAALALRDDPAFVVDGPAGLVEQRPELLVGEGVDLGVGHAGERIVGGVAVVGVGRCAGVVGGVIGARKVDVVDEVDLDASGRSHPELEAEPLEFAGEIVEGDVAQGAADAVLDELDHRRPAIGRLVAAGARQRRDAEAGDRHRAGETGDGVAAPTRSGERLRGFGDGVLGGGGGGVHRGSSRVGWVDASHPDDSSLRDR